MFASAPGKLILTGEYTVLDGAEALVIAVDRRVVARRTVTQVAPSPFLAAVADELLARGHDHAASLAREIEVDSTAFYTDGGKLGLGSSAAVTVAAMLLALTAETDDDLPPVIDRELVRELAMAAHARAQGERGARGSGADIAAAVHGGTIVFARDRSPIVSRHRWPTGVRLVPFFTGQSADTTTLVTAVAAARAARSAEVGAALTAIADASRATCAALAARAPGVGETGVLAGIRLAAHAFDRLAIATNLPLVPACVREVRRRLDANPDALGGTAKTTGAGGGDVAIVVIPATVDVGIATAAIVAAGGRPLDLGVDERGVDIGATSQ